MSLAPTEIWAWIISDAGLPLVFLVLMGVAMLLYAILDGYDLGVGLLMFNRPETERDFMIASIGPFWDANETWLVLGVGILLVAFPMAHGLVLGTLYLPVALMLAGLILRGVSFDFRAKARAQHKRLWDHLFSVGSLLTSLTQGYMLGQYIVGFTEGIGSIVFSLISAICVCAAYLLMGACWLVMKTEADLRNWAIRRARVAVPLVSSGLLLVSLVNPLVSERIFERWFVWPDMLWLIPLPLLSIVLLWWLWHSLGELEHGTARVGDGRPFVLALGVYVLSFAGLAYSFYPYIVPGQLTVWQAASAPEALRVIFWGVLVVLPAIGAYTALSYWIFRGKVRELSYG